MIRRLSDWTLTRPWVPVLVALLLAAPTLVGGLAADDRFHLVAVQEGAGPWDLFAFCPDDEQAREALRARGSIGWWASPALSVAFWRPLASLTHWLDYRLLGETAWPMHLQNIAWYAMIVGVTTGIYRRVIPGAGWAWAALFFAVDDAHGLALGWIASRNALVAAAFGLLAVRVHLDWLETGRRPWAAPGLFLLSLLGAEAGVAWLGYPAALAWERRRPWSMAGWLGVLVGWRLAWRLGGGGLVGAGVYVDPVATPLTFLEGALARVPVALMSKVWFVPPEVLGVAGGWAPVVALVSAVMVAVPAAVVLPGSPVRVWAVGAVLATLPLAASFPQDRTLLPVGFGVFLILGAWMPTASPGLARLVIGVHLWLAALTFPLRAVSYSAVDALIMARVDLLPVDDPSVVLNTAVDPVLLIYGTLRPGTVTLSAGQVTLTLRRLGPERLSVAAAEGWMPGVVDRMFRVEPFTVGERARTGDLWVTVTAITHDGRPSEIELVGDLEGRVWFAEVDGHLREVSLPRMGESVTVAPPGLPRW